MKELKDLSKREQEILEVLFRVGKASAKDIQAAMPDAPGNSAVRTHLRSLVSKGYVRLKEDGLKYVYFPAQDVSEVSRSALANLVDTFFKGEPVLAVNQLLNFKLDEISDSDLDQLEQLIKDHRAQQKDLSKD